MQRQTTHTHKRTLQKKYIYDERKILINNLSHNAAICLASNNALEQNCNGCQFSIPKL